MDNNQARPFDVSDALELLFRHKWKLLLLPLFTLTLATGLILFAPRTYVSEAKVMMRVGRESVGIDPTATTGQTMMLQQSGRDSEVQSAMDLLLSRGLAEMVVDKLGVDFVRGGGPPGAGKASPVYDTLMTPLQGAIAMVKSIDKVSPREEALIDFAENLTVEAERDSTVIVVSYETKSPHGAQEILQTLIDTYQQEYMHHFRHPRSRDFFAEQRDLLKEQLDSAQGNLREAKNRMGLASIEGRRSSYESQVSAIELALYTTEQDLATAQARIEDLRDQLADLPERLVASKTSKPNAGADLLREQLYALQVKQIDLKARYSDDHPLVKSVSAQVAEAEKIVNRQKATRQETVDDINPIHRELTVELKRQETLGAGLNARLRTLEEQKRLIMSDMKQLNRFEVELSELDRESQLANTKFFKYSENFEQARIDQALEHERISSISIPQSATLQEKPASPSKLLIGLAAIALSVGGAASWITAAEKLNTTIRNEADAQEALGLPVYASIPKHPTCARVLNN